MTFEAYAQRISFSTSLKVPLTLNLVVVDFQQWGRHERTSNLQGLWQRHLKQRYQ
jgi:hypothetical protein